MDFKLRKQAEDELIRELRLEENDDPPCVGGRNFTASNLWDALVKERMTNLQNQQRLSDASWAEENYREERRRQNYINDGGYQGGT